MADEDNKTYSCPDCGDEFSTPLELARHVKSEHGKKSKGGRGSRTESYLTEEDIQEFRDKEKRIKELELQLKEAKLNAELRKLQSVSEPPRLRKWTLPDGVIFEGTAQDYRDLLEVYYLQNQKKSAPAEDSTTIKALLDRLTQLEQALWEKKTLELEKKVDYVASRDPLQDASEAIHKFNQLAQAQGLVKAGSSLSDQAKLKHLEVQSQALLTGINAIDKKLSSTMARAQRLESEALPLLKKLGDMYLDDFRMRRGLGLGNPVPHSEGEIIAIARNLEKGGIQQEVAGKPAEPPKMKEFSGVNRMPGHDLSDRN